MALPACGVPLYMALAGAIVEVAGSVRQDTLCRTHARATDETDREGSVIRQSALTSSADWRDFGRVLRAHRDQCGLTLRDLAGRIAWHHSVIGKWELGKNRPPVEAVKALDAELGAGGELMAQALHAAMTDADQARKSTVEAKASTQDEDEDMERRRLIQGAATVAVGGAVAPVLAALTDAWQTYGPRISGASVSQEMIDDWEDAAEAHFERSYYDPPAVVLAALAVDYANLAPHLNRAQPEAVERDLAHAAARYSTLIAGEWYNLGNKREAYRWWKRTRTLADVSRDTVQASVLRSWEASHRRYDDGDVLPLLQEARRLAGERPSLTLFSALRVEAQVLAMKGRTSEAIIALNQAETVLEGLPAQTPGTVRPDWYTRSLVYTLAGDDRRADEAQDAARRAYDSGHIMSAVFELHRAAAQAHTDPEQGAQHALRTLDGLPVERRNNHILSDVQFTLAVLPEKAHALPAVRELRALTVGAQSF
ncbi:helix-turn-helix domain-containing protein [Streptosporangium jomthongense]|uniref:Helix-turn-helix domain-containing protein n=1 Tax=Streptosporangium jomthongense TaxID=1193683 RepID=A0ABV8F056_9ACTN